MAYSKLCKDAEEALQKANLADGSKLLVSPPPFARTPRAASTSPTLTLLVFLGQKNPNTAGLQPTETFIGSHVLV